METLNCKNCFFVEHFAMRGKIEEGKSLQLLSHTGEGAFEFCFQRFMDGNGDLLAEGREISFPL